MVKVSRQTVNGWINGKMPKRQSFNKIMHDIKCLTRLFFFRKQITQLLSRSIEQEEKRRLLQKNTKKEARLSSDDLKKGLSDPTKTDT
jgi:hypothetical protein